jgi:hypothetical protein
MGWRAVATVLPPLSEVVRGLPRTLDSVTGEISWYQPADNSWAKVSDLGAIGAFRIRRFSTLDVVRTQQDLVDGTLARCTVQLGKHAAALLRGQPLVAYDPTERRLVVPLGADLPGLYGRVAVAASGNPPIVVGQHRELHYEDVPSELARLIYDRLSN